MKYFPLFAVLFLSVPLAAQPVDFDRAIDPGAVLSAAPTHACPQILIPF
jgi:hypothetical protein